MNRLHAQIEEDLLGWATHDAQAAVVVEAVGAVSLAGVGAADVAVAHTQGRVGIPILGAGAEVEEAGSQEVGFLALAPGGGSLVDLQVAPQGPEIHAPTIRVPVAQAQTVVGLVLEVRLAFEHGLTDVPRHPARALLGREGQRGSRQQEQQRFLHVVPP